MNFINDFIQTYGMTIVYAALTAIAGVLSAGIKKLFTKYVNDKTKRAVAKTCVKATEQIYKDLHGEEKLNKCTEAMSEMLMEKGITVTALELRLLIEEAVKDLGTQIKEFLDEAEE